MQLPARGLSSIIVDVVEKEDRQEFLRRLLTYSYIAVIQERVQSEISRHKDQTGDNKDCETEWTPDSLIDEVIQQLWIFDHEAVLRWHDLINKMTHPCTGLEIYDAYRAFRENPDKLKATCRNIVQDDNLYNLIAEVHGVVNPLM